MRIVLLLTFVFCYSFTFGQTRKVRGEVRDRITGEVLSGVHITPDFFGNDTTNDEGRFKIIVPADYKDTIRFSHSGYFPFFYKVKTSVPLLIYLTPSTIGIDTVYQPALEECRMTGLQVIDRKNHIHIKNVSILTTDSLTLGVTNLKGKSNFYVPKTTDTLIFTHPDYVTKVRELKKRDLHHTILIYLNRLKQGGYENALRISRNALQACPFELFNLGLGIRYTHFIKNHLAVGIHSTFYFQSLFGHLAPSNRYDGIKTAPFFRFYFFRNIYKGAFLETKLIGGYFSSDKIVYSEPDRDNGTLYSDSFRTVGAGLSIGYDWYILEKVDIGFTLGVQIFPNGAPKSITWHGYYMERGSNSIFPLDNWYFAGPGSIVEIKFLIGGLF